MEAPKDFLRLGDPFTGSAFWELPAVSLRECIWACREVGVPAEWFVSLLASLENQPKTGTLEKTHPYDATVGEEESKDFLGPLFREMPICVPA